MNVLTEIYTEIPELITTFYILVLIVYQFRERVIVDLKTRVFRALCIGTAVAALINYFSCIAIERYLEIPIWFNSILSNVYFLSTGLVPYLFVIYILAYLYNQGSKFKKGALLLLIPYFFLIVSLVINSFTGIIFSFSIEKGYVKGFFNTWFYGFFYLYLVIALVIVLINRKTLDKSFARIFYLFPIFSFIVILLQLYFLYICKENIMLSGTSAGIPIYVIYLYLQRKQVTRDEVTGAFNRRVFLIDLHHIEKKSNDYVCYLGIHEFSQMNLKYGQKTGDDILRKIFMYLRSVADEEFIYRYGGDRFSFILKNKAKNQDIIDEIVKRFEKPFNLSDDLSVKLNLKMAVLNHGQFDFTYDQEISVLGTLYHNLKPGKNVAYCTEKTKLQIERDEYLYDLVKKSIEEEKFEIYFQPVFDIKVGKFLSCEVLSRLKDKDEFISPVEFIGIIEKKGLDEKFDRLVVTKTIKTIRKLMDLGIDMSASINLCSLKLLQDDEIWHLVNEYKVEPQRIKIEITEKVFVENPGEMQDIIDRYLDYGIKFYLDDFGTGFSNLSAVLDTQFDLIKIDRSLIVSAEQSKKGLDVLNALSNAFVNNDMKILVEGVETEIQNDLAIRIGGKYVQGFLYSTVLPFDEFVAFLRKMNKGK